MLFSIRACASSRRRATSSALILGTVFFAMFLVPTLYMQQVLGLPPMWTSILGTWRWPAR